MDSVKTVLNKAAEQARAVTGAGLAFGRALFAGEKPRMAIALFGGGFLGLAALIAFITFFAGYAVGRHKIGPFNLATKVERKLFAGITDPLRDANASNQFATKRTFIQSNMVPFDIATVQLPDKGQSYGGALTTINGEIIVITQLGDVYGVDETKATPLNVELPDNYFAQYKAAANGRFSSLSHKPNEFRYNDLQYFPYGEFGALFGSYTEWDDAQSCYRTVAVKHVFTAPVASVASLEIASGDWERIFASEPCLPLKEIDVALSGVTSGGRITFQAPDTLILANGDYHWDGVYSEHAVSQDMSYEYGKVIAINIESGDHRFISSGHRNIQGIDFDRDGRLWAVEHGMQGGDELNVIRQGEDYGWPQETLGTRYDKRPWPGAHSNGHHDVFTPPAYAFIPSIAISSLRRIEDFHPAWDGDFLLASLKVGNLYRIRVAEESVRFVESINIGLRIRYAVPMAGGKIALFTDEQIVVIMSKTDATPSQKFVDSYINRLDGGAEFKTQMRAAVNGCLTCHAIDPVEVKSAPPLSLVAGKTFGSTGWSGYSNAIRSTDGTWTRKNLAAFIDAPESVIAGTSMADPAINDPELQRALADFVFALNDK